MEYGPISSTSTSLLSTSAEPVTPFLILEAGSVLVPALSTNSELLASSETLSVPATIFPPVSSVMGYNSASSLLLDIATPTSRSEIATLSDYRTTSSSFSITTTSSMVLTSGTATLASNPGLTSTAVRAILGGAVGGVIFLALVIGTIIYLARRRKILKKDNPVFIPVTADDMQQGYQDPVTALGYTRQLQDESMLVPVPSLPEFQYGIAQPYPSPGIFNRTLSRSWKALSREVTQDRVSKDGVSRHAISDQETIIEMELGVGESLGFGPVSPVSSLGSNTSSPISSDPRKAQDDFRVFTSQARAKSDL